jgi:MFS transporter, DHA1 family, arabinose polymer utilization protein
MTKKLFPLALGGLAIGTTEFAIMGLLPDVANDLNISIPIAGHLISIYALGVVIGAPILVALSAKFPAKNILIAFMILFTFFNFLSAIAPNYTTLLISRFFSGLPHGAFFGVGTVVAAKLAEKGKSAQAIAVMFTGLTIANVAMVPLTTYLGHTFSWRYAFAIVSIIGLITIFSLYKNLPKQKEVKTVTLKEELQFFKTIKAWHILAIVATGFGGLFAWISYIAPLLIHVTNFEESSVSYLMIVAGLGMLVGNIVGGYLADKRNPIKVAIFLLSMMIACLLLVFFLSEYKFATVVLTFLCGAFAMSIGAPINIIMLDSAKHSAMLGAAFLQAAFNVANSLGAFLGGIPLFMGLNYNYPSLSGALMALIGVGLCLIFLKKYKIQG